MFCNTAVSYSNYHVIFFSTHTNKQTRCSQPHTRPIFSQEGFQWLNKGEVMTDSTCVMTPQWDHRRLKKKSPRMDRA